MKIKSVLAMTLLILSIGFISSSNEFAYNVIPDEAGNETFNNNITYFNTYTTMGVNDTQMENLTVITIKESWLESLMHLLFDSLFTEFSSNITSMNTTANVQNLLAGTNISQFAFNQTLETFNAFNSTWDNRALIQDVNNSLLWNRSGTNLFPRNIGDKVGINTSSPSVAFEIAGGGEMLRLNGLGGWNYMKFTNGSTNLWSAGVDDVTRNYFIGDYNTTFGYDLSIKENGNVGIGTNAPTELLNLYKSSAGQIGLRIENPSFTTNGGVKIELSRGETYRPAQIVFQNGTMNEWYVGELRNGGNPNNAFSIGIGSDTAITTPYITILNATGYVGIGTNAPSSTFSVQNKIRLVSDGTLYWGNAGDAGRLSWDTGMAQIFGLAGKDLSLGAGGNANYLYIKNGGNVGIGTTSPAVKLHIVDTDATGLPNMFIDRYSEDFTAPYIVTRKARGTPALPSAVNLNDDIGGMYARGYGTNAWGSNNVAAIKFIAAETFTNTEQGTYMTFGTTPTGSVARAERMRITSDGKVGIGTTTPSHNLSVGKDLGAINTYNTIAVGDNYYATYYAGKDTDNYGFMQYVVADDQIKFGTRSDAANYINTLILKQGNVGIGTTSPTYKLVVGGTANPRLHLTSTNANTPNGYIQITGATTPYMSIDVGDDINYRAIVLHPAGFGNVGIGMTTPSQKLDVNGSINMSIAEANLYGGSGSQRLSLGTAGSTLYYNANNYVQIGGSLIKLYENSGTTLIATGGNVGIGTSTPNAKLQVVGGINQTSGNITANGIYGEMFNKSDTGFAIVDLTTQDVYVQIQNLTNGSINGVSVSSSNVSVNLGGVYMLNGVVSGSTGANSEYGLKVFVNDVGYNNCYSHLHLTAGGTAPMNFACLLKLNSGDNVSMKIDEHNNPPNDMTIYSANLNALRIGN